MKIRLDLHILNALVLRITSYEEIAHLVSMHAQLPAVFEQHDRIGTSPGKPENEHVSQLHGDILPRALLTSRPCGPNGGAFFEESDLTSSIVEEWLQLEPEDQRDLMFRALQKRFPLAEWVLWAISAATIKKDGTHDGWVAERPLVAVYRRWKKGEDWRERFKRNAFARTSIYG